MDFENKGILGGISPEEILARKEAQGGVVYDDPFVPESLPDPSLKPEGMMDAKPPVAEELKSLPKQRLGNLYEDPEDLTTSKPPQQEIPVLESLGRVETKSPPSSPEFSAGLEVGWKNLPLHLLPSKGLFYPAGTKIAIRPADVREIKHFSGIDENDLLDLNERLNYIISKCSTMNFPDQGVVSYKDLKNEDRFFLVMAIRDLTFVQGENRIIITPETKCEDKNACPVNQGIELRTGVLSSYEIDSRVMKYYSPTTRNFVFPVRKLGKEITMTVPSIGVMDVISEFIIRSEKKGIEIDESFIKISPFIFPEWRGLDDRKILQRMRESDDWSKEEFSLYFELCETIKIGTELDINLKCPTCGAEVTAPITFPSGFKSLFVISDIFRELL